MPEIPRPLVTAGIDPNSFLYEPSPLPAVDRTELRRFRDALTDRSSRIAFGIHIPDQDAELLLRNPAWMTTFYLQWTGAEVSAEPGAPVALARLAAPAPTPRTRRSTPARPRRPRAARRTPVEAPEAA